MAGLNASLITDVNGKPLPQIYIDALNKMGVTQGDADGNQYVKDKATLDAIIQMHNTIKNAPEADYAGIIDGLTSVKASVDGLTEINVSNIPALQKVEDVKVKQALDNLITKVEANKPKELQNVSDEDVKSELEAIKQVQNNILAKLENGVNTQVTGSKLEQGLPVNVEDFDSLTDSQKEIINVISNNYAIYGVYWDKSSTPTLVRTNSAEDLVAEVGVGGEMVRNDFDNLPIWSEIGEVEDDYGNVFMRIPKLYIRKHVGKDFFSLQVSKTKHKGFYLPKVFWDFDNEKEIDYFDYGKYEASISDDGTKLESKANHQLYVQENIVNFRNRARANGKGYQQNDIHAIDVMQTLFTIEFATLDSQSIVRGYVDGNYSVAHTAVIAETSTNKVILTDAHAINYEAGQTLGIGVNNYSNSVSGTSRLITDIDRDYDTDNTAIHFDGDSINVSIGNVVANRGSLTGFSEDVYATTGSVNVDDGTNPFVYRGIENLYGSVYEFIDGLNIRDGQSWVAENADDYSSNVFASPYESLGYVNNGVNGYVKEMGFDKDYPYAEFPVEVGASTTTYYADYYYRNVGNRIARSGGSWSNGSNAGLFFWSLGHTSGNAHATSGGRLLRKLSN